MSRRLLNPNSRYHAQGARDAEARRGHAAASRRWRRQRAATRFTPDDQARLLELIRRGRTVAEAASEIGLSFQAVFKRTLWDPRFGDRLEKALAETCPAGQWCGTAAGARFHRGHCRACRHAKRARTNP
ncbi:hypothetical protein ACWDSJ_27760 [Nocardia sp. NPDC003482]